MAEEKDTTAPVTEAVNKKSVPRKRVAADRGARASPKTKDAKAQEILEKAKAEPSPEWEVTEQVVLVPLEQLKPFKNHPFKVRDDDELMQDTIDSIMAGGVINTLGMREQCQLRGKTIKAEFSEMEKYKKPMDATNSATMMSMANAEVSIHGDLH